MTQPTPLPNWWHKCRTTSLPRMFDAESPSREVDACWCDVKEACCLIHRKHVRPHAGGCILR